MSDKKNWTTYVVWYRLGPAPIQPMNVKASSEERAAAAAGEYLKRKYQDPPRSYRVVRAEPFIVTDESILEPEPPAPEPVAVVSHEEQKRRIEEKPRWPFAGREARA